MLHEVATTRDAATVKVSNVKHGAASNGFNAQGKWVNTGASVAATEQQTRHFMPRHQFAASAFNTEMNDSGKLENASILFHSNSGVRPIVAVRLVFAHGLSVDTYALLDTGSNRTCINKALSKRVNASVRYSAGPLLKINLNGLLF